MKNMILFGMHDIIGGVERYIENYYPYLQKEYSIDFVTPFQRMALEEEFTKYGSNVFHVASLRSPIKYLSQVNTILNRKHYEVSYVNLLSAANVFPIALSKRAGVEKVIAHAHNNSTPKGIVRKALHQINLTYIESNADQLLACSAEAARWLFPHKAKDGCTVVEDAINVEEFKFNTKKRIEIRDRLQIPSDAYVIGHVGRFEEQKNHMFFIDLIASLRSSGVEPYFLFVGDGLLRNSFRDAVDKYGYTEFVKTTGQVDTPSDYYSAMDLFVFPSFFEGFGMAMIEAQASGLPCIASTGVPRATNLTGSVQYLPLSKRPMWIQAIKDEAAKGPRSFSSRLGTNKMLLNSRYSIKASGETLLEVIRK